MNKTATWENVSYNYSGASVLVTGGTSGIGEGIAKAYRDAGANVTITGTRPSLSAYDGDFHGFRFLQLDVENRENIDKVAAAMSELDILICSAGTMMIAQGLDEYDPDVFERAVNMHLCSVYRMAARCVPKLSKSRLPGGASVITISSTTGILGYDVVPAYGSAKAGQIHMARVLAVQWAKQNIRINTLAAGLTHSRASDPAIAHPAVNAATLERIPLGRHGVPLDIAGAALFLSSASASWITGQTIPIDGGMLTTGIRVFDHLKGA